MQYAGEVFPASHVASRFILLLGAGDSNDDIRRASVSKLYSALNRAREKSKQMRGQKVGSDPEPLPDFVKMLIFVIDKANLRLKTQQRVVVGNTVLPFQLKKYEEILNFLRICMIHSAGVELPESDELKYPQSSAPKVSKYLQKLNEDPGKWVTLFAEFADNLLTASSGLAQTQCLLNLMGCAPFIASNYFGRLTW